MCCGTPGKVLFPLRDAVTEFLWLNSHGLGEQTEMVSGCFPKPRGMLVTAAKPVLTIRFLEKQLSIAQDRPGEVWL